MQLIAHGAEAKLYRDGDVLIKKRIPKHYRINEIDHELRRSRTRREAKVLQKIVIPVPKLLEMDDEKMVIKMSFIEGHKVRDVLEENMPICNLIGKYTALMHNQGIMHGDLTTSNMIWSDDLYFIDFGLSFFSDKIEDKAVDLHVLSQALESKHHTIYSEAFDMVLQAYKEHADEAGSVLKRLNKVQMRGRNKKKG